MNLVLRDLNYEYRHCNQDDSSTRVVAVEANPEGATLRGKVTLCLSRRMSLNSGNWDTNDAGV